MTGGIFETFCFPVVLALCLWWFAVAQAAGLNAFVASGLDAFLARYNCFLWILKVTGSTLCWHYGGWFGRFPGQWFGRFPGQLHLFFMDSKGDGRHFWNVLFSGRLGPVSMVVCCSAGGWFGRFRGQWFGRFLWICFPVVCGQHSVLALRQLVWTLSWPVVWTLSSPVTLVFYGFQRWQEAFLKRYVFRLSWPCVYGGLL